MLRLLAGHPPALALPPGATDCHIQRLDSSRYLWDALSHFGTAACGVVAVGADFSDAMTRRGVRGARIMGILQDAVGLDKLSTKAAPADIAKPVL